MKNLNLSVPTTIGGLFYFENSTRGNIYSSGNTFEKCNTTTEGAIFYLR
jgi:hypothetical protein